MPKPAQDHVHRLIRSMSRTEKRYFKLYTSRHLVAGHSNQQALFDAIAAMPTYDLKALQKQFAGEAFMRRFSITKRRLYETVLNSLDAFHAESSMDDKLRRMLHHVELLHRRALYADAAKVLRATRSLARANDKQAVLLQVAEWERRTMERGNYAGVTSVDLIERAGSLADVAAEWQEVERLWQIKSSSFLLIYRSGQAPSPKELAELEALAKEPLLAEDSVLRSARARFLHHHIRSALAYAQNDLPTCELQLIACANVLRKEQKHFAEEPDLALGVMGNLAHVRMRLGKHQQALDGFWEFRKIPLTMEKAPTADLEMKLFVMGSSLELSVFSAKGEFQKAIAQLTNLEEGLERYHDRTSTVRRVELALQAAYVSLGAKEYERALRWCNLLLNEKGIETHTELHALGRILNVMSLVELGKVDLLSYLVRNTQRALKQHGAPYVMEQVLLEHAETLAKAIKAREKHQPWNVVLAELESTVKAPREGAVMDHVDLVTWARAKAEGKEFAELVREKWSLQQSPKGGTPKRTGRRQAA